MSPGILPGDRAISARKLGDFAFRRLRLRGEPEAARALPSRRGVSRRSLALLALIPFCLAGCRFEPTGDSPLDPPAEYREWWAKTEACSGLSGDFDRVRWQVVAGHSFDCPSGQCVGHWESNHEIYLSEDWAMNEMVVRHEMLHDLLGRPGHPTPPFGHGCPLTWSTWPQEHHPANSLAARIPVD